MPIYSADGVDAEVRAVDRHLDSTLFQFWTSKKLSFINGDWYLLDEIQVGKTVSISISGSPLSKYECQPDVGMVEFKWIILYEVL